MAPPQGQMRPGRQLAWLGGLFVVLYLMVFFVATDNGKMGMRERLHPKLGLDLVGGRQITLQARVPAGHKNPTPEEMDKAADQLTKRVNALGVTEAQIVVSGQQVIISKAGGTSGKDNLSEQIGNATQLRFRTVLNATDGSGGVTPTPTPSAMTKPATTKPAPAASGSATPKASGTPGRAAPPTNASPVPSPSASSAAPALTLKDVETAVGAPAMAAAKALTAPPTTPNPALKPFAKLTEAQLAALPAEMVFNVPQISCAMLDARTPGAIDAVDVKQVACENGAKMLLDVATVTGDDITNASPQLDQQGQRNVSISFSSSGATRWHALTTAGFNNTGNKCAPAALGDQQKCRVAVTLDNAIISSPQIIGVSDAETSITGGFTADQANSLAQSLQLGALSVSFVTLTDNQVSSTVGTGQLRAGLLAAAIGLLLVVLYSFFYYRLLGSVITLSLVLSGVLVFGALVVLGRTMDFRLSLAGIAGFIVSLGVAADSFVIYFERLKDEIQEGRSPRSAVPRAWARAKRTIISANAITFMAAVILYIVSVGAVQGFAFALGLATVLDLVVVFLFRHPIMTLFASTKAFLSPRVSGLGRVLQRDTVTEA